MQLRKSTKSALIVISIVCLVGCTTTRSVWQPGFEEGSEKFDRGDELVVEYIYNREEQVIYERMDAEFLYTESGMIPLEHIHRIRVEELDVAKTLEGTAVATGIVVVAVVYTAVLVAGVVFFIAVTVR